jgi:DNA-binding LacI/PurR family transcriptional regulator
VTISDIARRAGVSKGAVSYALNDRPGVSPATRSRILAIADELDWHPNNAARALSASRAGACGLVLARPARTFTEPFFMELIAGLEGELAARSFGLMLQVVEDIASEMAVYRRWWAERRVDGVLVCDLRADDPRIALLEDLDLPAVVVGGPGGTGSLTAVWNEDEALMTEVVRYLARFGHRRIGRVAGVPGFVHTEERAKAFLGAIDELGVSSVTVPTDYSRESGAQGTRTLLLDPDPPTAIVYDSELLAVAGLAVTHEMRLSVPGDVSLVAWDDLLLCEVVHPPLTAVSRDIRAYGAHAATALLELLEVGSSASRGEARGRLTPRASTGPAPRREARPA